MGKNEAQCICAKIGNSNKIYTCTHTQEILLSCTVIIHVNVMSCLQADNTAKLEIGLEDEAT